MFYRAEGWDNALWNAQVSLCRIVLIIVRRFEVFVKRFLGRRCSKWIECSGWLVMPRTADCKTCFHFALCWISIEARRSRKPGNKSTNSNENPCRVTQGTLKISFVLSFPNLLLTKTHINSLGSLLLYIYSPHIHAFRSILIPDWRAVVREFPVCKMLKHLQAP